MFRKSLALVFLALALLAAVDHADAAAPGKRRLRAQIVDLQTKVAQLSTEVGFLSRSADSQPAGAANGKPVFGHGPIVGGVMSMCDDPCAADSDGDGIGDCLDVCPCDPNTTDTDGDTVPDCADPCADDPTDACIDPCRQDSDSDGINDCEDKCPYDPAAAVDSDGDGVVDCQDICPDDPTNQCFDWCKMDQDGDGIADCKDWCPWMTSNADASICIPPPSLPQTHPSLR